MESLGVIQPSFECGRASLQSRGQVSSSAQAWGSERKSVSLSISPRSRPLKLSF